MAVDNQFKETVDALFKGMNGVVSSKTVVGDAIHIGDTIILPLVDVFFCNRSRGISCGQKGQRSRRTRRKDDPECGACDPERNNQTGQHQKSGYHDQDPGYGPGCDRPF